MFNRRFLRIKVFQQRYAYSKDVQPMLTAYEKNLIASLDKANDLYLYLMSVPVALKTFAQHELEQETGKFYPSDLRKAPLEKIVYNKAIQKLEASEYLNKKVKPLAMKGTNSDDLYRNFMLQIKENDYISQLGTLPVTTFTEQKNMVAELMQILIGESDLFNEYMEELFRNWEDDQTTATMMMLKSFEKMKENESDEFISHPDNDSEDLTFMKDLFRKSVEMDEELTGYIAGKTKNWDADRIAEADMILMKLALCEILYFPYVPVKVSINEYLELAKLYSTPNSHGFINGILDKIQLSLRKENLIVKSGRGLVE